MGKRSLVSPKHSPLSRNGTSFVAACLCITVTFAAAAARAQVPDPPPLGPPPEVVMPPPAPPTAVFVEPVAVVPSHLVIGNQHFEASVSGVRDYLDSIKATQPLLYQQLAPDVARLEARQRHAIAALVIGGGLAALMVPLGLAAKKSCPDPVLGDPRFGAEVTAWGACNDQNSATFTTFALAGAGALLAGGLAAVALMPRRADLLDLVNKHNRASAEPLRLELGYDPQSRVAFGGAALRF
jgi:hypothetical protein